MDFPGTDLEIKIMLSTGGRGSRNAFACSIFSRFVRHTRVGRDPVGFPGLAAIVRKRLFEAAGIGGDVRNDKADINGAAIERFLSKNSPRPFLNSPMVGWLNVPLLLFAKFRLHW